MPCRPRYLLRLPDGHQLAGKSSCVLLSSWLVFHGFSLLSHNGNVPTTLSWKQNNKRCSMTHQANCTSSRQPPRWRFVDASRLKKRKTQKKKSRDKCEGRDKKLRKIDGQKMTGMQHACLSPFRSFVYMWPYRWTPCTFHSGNSRIPTPKAAPKWPPIRRLPGAPQLLRYMKGLTQNSLGLLRMFAAMFALFCIRMEHIGTSHFITALWVLDSCRHEVVQACARDKAPRAFDFVYCLRWSMIKSSI